MKIKCVNFLCWYSKALSFLLEKMNEVKVNLTPAGVSRLGHISIKYNK